MMAALPDKPYATPQKPRRVLVLARALGWVHTSIPLAAKMVEYLGDKTGAWMTTITYDATAITPENLKQYDAVFLSSTTGEFLNDPNDKAATDLRRQALLDFVKGGKGLAGIHAATDSYHANNPTPTGTWPEFNEMIGGFFKFHWTYPTLIPVKIDDPESPLTSMFPARGYDIVDETYTFAQDSFSRKRVHVLTSRNTYVPMSFDVMPESDSGRARPKSRMRSVPCSSSIRFAGLRSRCRRPFECAAAMPRVAWTNQSRQRFLTRSGSLFRRVWRFGPSRNSMAR